MTFHVRVALSGVHGEPARSVVAIGETVLIKESGNVNLTAGIARKYGDISYSLEESEEPAPPKKAPSAPSGAASKPQKKAEESGSEDFDGDDDDEEEEEEQGSAEILKSGLTGNLASSRLRSKAVQ